MSVFTVTYRQEIRCTVYATSDGRSADLRRQTIRSAVTYCTLLKTTPPTQLPMFSEPCNRDSAHFVALVHIHEIIIHFRAIITSEREALANSHWVRDFSHIIIRGRPDPARPTDHHDFQELMYIFGIPHPINKRSSRASAAIDIRASDR